MLPAEATNAPVLLGMTFSGRFNFSMNGTELVLSKIDAERTATVKPKKGRFGKSREENDPLVRIGFQREMRPDRRFLPVFAEMALRQILPVANLPHPSLSTL